MVFVSEFVPFTSAPRNRLYEPVVALEPASNPNAALRWPVELEKSAKAFAVFRVPIVLEWSAPLPVAALPLPVVLEYSVSSPGRGVGAARCIEEHRVRAAGPVLTARGVGIKGFPPARCVGDPKSVGIQSVSPVGRVDPTSVVLSAGHDHNHPSDSAAQRYLTHGVLQANMFRTDRGDDEPGSFEWKDGSIAGCTDARGDDDDEIVVTDTGALSVLYRHSQSGC